MHKTSKSKWKFKYRSAYFGYFCLLGQIQHYWLLSACCTTVKHRTRLWNFSLLSITWCPLHVKENQRRQSESVIHESPCLCFFFIRFAHTWAPQAVARMVECALLLLLSSRGGKVKCNCQRGRGGEDPSRRECSVSTAAAGIHFYFCYWGDTFPLCRLATCPPPTWHIQLQTLKEATQSPDANRLAGRLGNKQNNFVSSDSDEFWKTFHQLKGTVNHSATTSTRESVPRPFPNNPPPPQKKALI